MSRCATLLFAIVFFLHWERFCQAQATIEFGPLTDLRTDEGPLSFGTVVSADVVSWSAPDARDLLIGRLWEGVYLYPSRDLEAISEPIRLCDQLGHVVLMVEPVDWNGDGEPDVIGTDREGKIFCLQRVGEFPHLKLAPAFDPLKTPEGLTYNIPFDNPQFRLSSQSDYIRPEYFNYTYATAYPGANERQNDLIVGDWGGALWYMVHSGVRDGAPLYAGTAYHKRDGQEFAMPLLKLADDNGEEFRLGENQDAGMRYRGGAARPVHYHNARTKTDDLLVLCGTTGNELRYLHRIRTGNMGQPVFDDLGLVTVEGYDDGQFDPYSYHAVVTLFGDGPWPDLLISRGSEIAVCRNLRRDETKPAFRFDRWISGRNVPTRGANYTEILNDHAGRRFLLDNDNQWYFRELLNQDGKPQVSSQRHPLYDQSGMFRVAGETDSVHAERWGFHRAALWDYDGTGQQHLIVGTDKGLLYLLRHEQPLGRNGRFEFRSFGPLTAADGAVIRVHNRVVAAPLDLDGDGRLDLVLAGATYQMGFGLDPRPGSGIYYSLNQGAQPDGSPLLSPVKPLETVGHEHPDFRNGHAQLQSLDLLGTGERLLVIGTQQGDGFSGYVYRPVSGRVAVEHTGMILPPISIEERLLDLDADGDWEYVRSGGESLISTFGPVIIRDQQR